MKETFTSILFLFVMLIMGSTTISAQTEKTPAFPGAEGYGRYVTGGRGGKVYHVTTLADAGVGSLRWAVEKSGARTIVFDVSGTIHLKSQLKIRNGNLTIAGQTAPGDGICVGDWDVVIAAPNVIIRYMRFRPGDVSKGEPDGLGGYDGKQIIVDHCSVSWSVDECCSVYGNEHMTVQWCLIGQSLRNSSHSKSAHGYGGNWGGKGASYHHNLLAHHDSRVPRLGNRPMFAGRDTSDFRNNVYYNWGGNGCYGGEGMKANIVNCYYKPGPGTDERASGSHAYLKYRILGAGITTDPNNPLCDVWGKYFVEGNYNPNSQNMNNDNWKYGVWDQITQNKPNDDAQDTIRLTEPMPFMWVTTHTAQDAYSRVLDYAGASLHRDRVDSVIVNDTRKRRATYTGDRTKGDIWGIIDNEWDTKPANADSTWTPWPTLASLPAPTDTDQDGMPDDWELANGLDPNNADDGAQVGSEEGYTNLELYMNSLVADITAAQNEGGTEEGYKEYREAVQQMYTVSKETKEETGWTFGHDIALSNTEGGSYGTTGNYIRMARDKQHTLTLPDGVEIVSVEFAGKGRYTSYDDDASLIELNGEQFEKGKYVLTKGVETSFIVDLATPAQGTLTFTFTGNNPDCMINLFTSKAAAGIRTYTTEPVRSDLGWYTLQGVRIPQPTKKGIYIHNGKKIIVK